VLGTRLKVIYGYPSGPEMTLALERGEVEGRSTSNPQVLAPTKAEILAKYNFIIQAGERRLPLFEEVPLLRELARSADEQSVFDFVSSAVVIARPIVTNAGVPAERGAALRHPFHLTLADPGFLADAARPALARGGGGEASGERGEGGGGAAGDRRAIDREPPRRARARPPRDPDQGRRAGEGRHIARRIICSAEYSGAGYHGRLHSGGRG